MPIKKYFKKQVKKAGRYAKKRYFKGKGYSQPKYGTMYNDLQKLKRIVNSEKKQWVKANTPGTLVTLGQVDENASGAAVVDITPKPTQDATDSGRNGDSIKAVSCVINFNFIQQTSTVCKINFFLEIWYTAKPQVDINNNIVNLLYKNDPTLNGSGIITYSSHIDQDYRQLFKLISRRKLSVTMDRISGSSGMKPYKLNLSLNKGFGTHIKFIENTDTPAVGQFVMILRADRRNSSTANASTLSGVIDTAANTGIKFSYNTTWYYYDN